MFTSLFFNRAVDELNTYCISSGKSPPLTATLFVNDNSSVGAFVAFIRCHKKENKIILICKRCNLCADSKQMKNHLFIKCKHWRNRSFLWLRMNYHYTNAQVTSKQTTPTYDWHCMSFLQFLPEIRQRILLMGKIALTTLMFSDWLFVSNQLEMWYKTSSENTICMWIIATLIAHLAEKSINCHWFFCYVLQETKTHKTKKPFTLTFHFRKWLFLLKHSPKCCSVKNVWTI